MSNRIETLLQGLNDWRFKTGKFLDRQPVADHEAHRYMSTFYRTEAWYLNQLAQEWDLNNEDNVFKVDPPKKEYLKVEQI